MITKRYPIMLNKQLLQHLDDRRLDKAHACSIHRKHHRFY